jgi:uncharacterized protein YraI/heat shock protein HslJ
MEQSSKKSKQGKSVSSLSRLWVLVLVFAFALGACTGGSSQAEPTDTVLALTNTPAPPTETPSPAPPTLVPTQPPPTATPTLSFVAPQDLVGKVWQWLRLESSDGTTQSVDAPSKYTLEFLPDGTLQGLADCNTMGGTYSVNNASMSLQVTQLTLMACPPDSLADQYVQRLNETASYVIESGVLYLNLKMDAGNMVFGEQTVPLLPTPAAGLPSATATVNVNLRSGPGTSYPVYGVMPYGRSAEIVGKSQDSQWWAVSIPLAPLGRGWVSNQYVQVANTDAVQVLDAPPVPPTAEVTAPGPDDPQVTVLDATYVRGGPGETYPAYGVAPVGATAAAIGISQDGQWYIVRVNPALVSTGSVWLQAAFLATKNVANIAVVQAPTLPDTLTIPTPAPGTPIGVCMTAINVRSGPGTGFPVLAVAPAGATVEVTGKSADGGWVQVKVPTTYSSNGLAWMSTSYVYVLNPGSLQVVASPTPAAPVVPPVPSGTVQIATTTEPVNVRSGPGSQYSSYGTVPVGTSGVVIEFSPDGRWVAIKLPTSIAKDGKGWVSMAYVVITTVNQGTATALAPTKILVPATSTPGGALSCKVVSVKPAQNKIFAPKTQFDMQVVVQNTGTNNWDPTAIDIKFFSASGAKIHEGADIYDFPAAVAPGAQHTFAIDMLAPVNPGTFGETWGLVTGSNVLCQWSISIVVQ